MLILNLSDNQNWCFESPHVLIVTDNFFSPVGPVIFSDKDYRMTQTWVLICDQLLSRAAEHGTLFQLRQGDVSLLVTVRKMPHFNLTEEVIDPKTNKFVLRLNSETSVWWFYLKNGVRRGEKNCRWDRRE